MFEEIDKLDKKLPTSKEIKKYRKTITEKYNLYQIIAIGVFVVGFIMGIILGNNYAQCESYSKINEMCLEETFNIGFMLFTWIITFVIGVLIIALGQIIQLLTKINEKLENGNKKK